MALIRQAAASAIAHDAIVLDLSDLKKQGEQLRARAQAQADQILAEAHAERDRLLASAREEGRIQGFEQGRAEGLEAGTMQGRQEALQEQRVALSKLDERWTQTLAVFESERERIIQEARQDVLTLAVRLGEAVTRRMLQLNPASAIDQVATALSLISRETHIVIAVHADDVPLLQEALPSLVQRFAAAAHAQISADPSISRGGCILRLPSGAQIDATIETQLSRIVDALLPSAGEGNAQ